MPINKPQHLRSLNTINLQPDKLTQKTMVMMYAELGGLGNGDIAKMMGMTDSRVSIIRNCPLYKQRIGELKKEFEKSVLDKQSDKIVAGDPVENLIKDACLTAARKKIELMGGAESQFVQNAAASDILGIGGYQKKTSKTTTVIEVDTKMAERWERVLSDGHSPNEGKHKIRVTQEMSG